MDKQKVQEAWKNYLKFLDESKNLFDVSEKLYIEVKKIYDNEPDYFLKGGTTGCLKIRSEADKFWYEAQELCAKAGSLRAEGRLILFRIIFEVYGNVNVDWNGLDRLVIGEDEYKR